MQLFSLLSELNIHLLEFGEDATDVIGINTDVTDDKIVTFMYEGFTLDEVKLAIANGEPRSYLGSKKIQRHDNMSHDFCAKNENTTITQDN